VNAQCRRIGYTPSTVANECRFRDIPSHLKKLATVCWTCEPAIPNYLQPNARGVAASVAAKIVLVQARHTFFPVRFGFLFMIKRFIIALVLVVLVCGGLIGFNLFRDNAIEQFFANMPRPTVTVPTVEVEPVTWQPAIDAIGTVIAAQGVDLTVETAGIVREVLFSPNQRVEQGELLVQLENTVQEADLAAAKAQAALDQQTLERARTLLSRGVGSETDVENAEAAATASAAQVEKLQAVLDQRQLTAPFAGTIGLPRIDVGQYLTPGTIVATLQDLDTVRVDFSVPEQQLPSLKMGQPVRVGITADDMPFSGEIVGIDPKVDPETRLVAVRAEVPDAGGRLNPGQFVRVRVILPDEEGVIAIPQTGLVSSLYGDYVFLVVPAEAQAEPAAAESEQPMASVEGTQPSEQSSGSGASAQAGETEALVARQVFVKIGRRSGSLVEIVEGLSPGDQVVTAGQNRLTNGAPVTVDNSVNPADGVTTGNGSRPQAARR
jgi:membrane fusion protein (multidrug efflux system)